MADLCYTGQMKQLSQDIVPILLKYGVTRAGLFGSCAREEMTRASDVDILIQPPENMGLSFVRLHRELEASLGQKVDLVTYQGLSPYMREAVLKEQVKLI